MSIEKKNVTSGVVKMLLEYGKANPAPPVGAVLGQRGLSAPEFCKNFNAIARPIDVPDGLKARVYVAFTGKKMSSSVKKPRTSDLIKFVTGLEKGSSTPNAVSPLKMTSEQITKVALIKAGDMNTRNLAMVVSMITSTAKSMGIKVVD